MFFENDKKIAISEPHILLAQSEAGNHLEKLRGELVSILQSEAGFRETIKQLDNELSVYKRAYAGVEAERLRNEQKIQDSEKKREDLENQLKGHRVIALLDGDGAIFNSQLMSQGQSGGHAAAQKLSDAIIQQLIVTNGVNQYQLWVYVFLNKRGLMEALGRAGHPAAKIKFEEFIMGFNQAAERFLMLDVGSAKEAADAKIKALLEDEIRLPQTEKIVFGGCHDNGYATTLRSQITAGYKHKLILLRSYSEMATGINELELPSFSIPDLFMAQKLAVPSSLPHTNSTPAHIPAALPTISPPVERPMVHRPSISTIQQGFEALPFASIELEETVRKQSLPPPSYSSAVQAPPKRVATPDLDSSGSTSSSDESEDGASVRHISLTNSRSRRVNPNILLSKHKPPPCTLFYLSTCKHGADCKYGHDYLLQPEHYTEIRVNAKKSPCPSRNKGDVCLWGDDCCYGHYCPMTTKCHYMKQGRCKFVGADMHKETKNPTADMA